MSKEKVLLVVIDYKLRDRDAWTAREVLDEMKELVVACQGEVVDSVIFKEDRPSPRFLVSEGKVKAINELLVLRDVDSVIFSHDLKGSQQRNIEEEIHKKTIDRTQLILDIFARRATTSEGKTQVELAQLEYMLPRLVGKGIEMSQIGGGIGTLGPGETKLELDRRRIAKRIDRLKKDLEEITSNRKIKRKKRIDKHVPSISLIGYTNAGKSTLFNRLTQGEQKTKDGLFTTLESLSRQLILPNNQKVIISDTVGFMQNLPHHLIESFKATLEEVNEADILLHVLDVSNPNFRKLHDAVIDVLGQLDIKNKTIITVLNKIDNLKDKEQYKELINNYENSVFISALSGENINELQVLIENMLSHFIKEIDVNIPIGRMDLVSLVHEQGEVHSIKYYEDTINIRAIVPSHLAGRFELNKKKEEE